MFADSAQRDELKKIEKLLKAGKLKKVRDTPDYWKKYTSIEIAYILDYYKAKRA